MDKKRSIKNITVSLLFRVALLVGSLLVRRYLIRCIGNDVNGLNSLYLSILNVLSVAELGIDSSIIFCMYKPIVEGDHEKVSALYRLFTKLYIIFATIIVVCGCAVMPALPYLAKNHASTGVNLYLTFGLMLISVVISYTFSSKTSLINAYKNNYITTSINSVCLLLQYAMQITTLVITRSFVWYLICRIVAVVVQWGITEIIARKKHGAIIKDKQKVDADTRKAVTKNVRAMFMHKVGYVLVNAADSLIISAFISISMLGGYTNYTAIVTSMVSVITLCFTPLTSVIGHMFVEESHDNAKRYFNFFHTFNFILAVVFFFGYYAIIDDLVAIVFGANLIMSRSVAMVITVNYFIQFMRRSTILFRDASGTFYNNRWMPVIEGVINVALSILFVMVFPKEYGVVGVIVATIITNILICHIIDPRVLYKYALYTSPKRFYIRNYTYIAVFAAMLFLLNYCTVHLSSRVAELFVNGFIAVALAVVPCAVAGLLNKDFRHYFAVMVRRIKSKFAHKPHVAEPGPVAETAGQSDDILSDNQVSEIEATDSATEAEDGHSVDIED